MRGSHLAVGATVVVDEGSRSEPQLCTVLAARVHDAEVVDARLEKLSFLFARQLTDTTDQKVYLLVLPPKTTTTKLEVNKHYCWESVIKLKFKYNVRAVKGYFLCKKGGGMGLTSFSWRKSFLQLSLPSSSDSTVAL